jgi:hypothetical protein
VNRAIRERGRERVVDEPVLLDEREACESYACDRHLEVVAAARAIDHGNLSGLGERLAQKILEAVSHPRDDSIGVGG